MKKILYQGRNNMVRSLTSNWFSTFSGTIFFLLFIVSSVAVWYGQVCVTQNGKKVCYMLSHDPD